MLLKSLDRINLPKTFTSFVKNIFFPRYNRIFTKVGTTANYLVHSGIDQGEIISPILWCIYYDPLLCKIQNSLFGYHQQVTWNPDINNSNPMLSDEHIPALAYMDDTLWLANSRHDLE